MNRFAFTAFLLMLTALAVACDGEELPTLVPTQAPIVIPTATLIEEPTPVPDPTQVPSPTPEPMVEPQTAMPTATPTTSLVPSEHDPNPQLVDKVWQWQRHTADEEEITVVPDPENYTLMFQTGGTAVIQADCNQVNWTYTSAENNLTFDTLGPSTLAFCGEDSLDQQYLALLGETTSFVIDGDQLFLDLELNAGNMAFSHGIQEEESLSVTLSEDELPPDLIRIDLQGLADTYEWRVVEGNPIPSGPGGQGLPQHIVLGFDGQDPLAMPYPERKIMYIFPVDAYIDLYAAAGSAIVADQVARLEELLAQADGRQANPEGTLPLLPSPTSIMDRWVQFTDLDFQNGQGVRYISDSPFRQSIGVWTNETMGYYYQGLTDDGQFYISLHWPISSDLLPDNEAAAPADILNQASANQESYDQYSAELKTVLNELEPTDWTPDLTELDALVQSLTFQLN